MSDFEDLSARYSAAKKDSDQWTSLLHDAYKYAIPGRERFYQKQQGARVESEVFDATAVDGVEKFASRVQSLLMPAWQKFSKIVPGPAVSDDDREGLEEKLEDINNLLFQHFHHSNLDMAANEAIKDMSISLGNMLFEEGDLSNGEPLFNFTSVPTSHCFPEEGAFGKLDGMWRDINIPVRAITTTWLDANLCKDLEQMIKDKPQEKVKLVEGTISNNDGTWRYVVMYNEDKHLIVDRQRNDYPWIPFRWSKTPGEKLGRGPVLSVLPHIMVLNKADEFRLRAAALAIGGIFTARNDGVLNPYNVQLIPNTVIPVGSNENSNPSLKALDLPMLPEMGQLFVEERRELVRKTLMSDPFGDPTAPVKSATEMMIRSQELAQTTGSQFSRMITELIVPLVKRGLYLLEKNGLIDPITIDGKTITLEHQSPLARLQDQEDLQGLMQYLEVMSSFGLEHLQITTKIENLGDVIGPKLGVSADLRRNEDERVDYLEDMKNRVAQMMAQQQMQQQEAQKNGPA